MGIKVRDFAYESTLPPISSVPQFVGGPRPLKRERTHEDGGDSPSLPHSPSHARGGHFAVLKKAKGLARELTEPVDPPSVPGQTSLARHTGVHDFSQTLASFTVGSSRGVSHPTTPHRQVYAGNPFPLSGSPLAALGIYASPQNQESQESEAWIDTPLVTPKCSLQWGVADTSAIPMSQLDTASQEQPAEDVTFSQLGFPDPSQQYSQSILEASPGSPSSPSSSARATRTSLSPSPSRPHRTARSAEGPLKPLATEAMTNPATPSGPRYNLRDRANPTILPATTITPPARSRSRSRSRSRETRSNSLSPRRQPARVRSPGPKSKRAPSSAQTLRRSARHVPKVADQDAAPP